MSAVVAFWLGGAIACAFIFGAEVMADEEPQDSGENVWLLLGAIIWPLTVAGFLVDVLRGWSR